MSFFDIVVLYLNVVRTLSFVAIFCHGLSAIFLSCSVTPFIHGFTGKHLVLVQHCFKNFAELVCHSENFSNFDFDEYSDKDILNSRKNYSK